MSSRRTLESRSIDRFAEDPFAESCLDRFSNHQVNLGAEELFEQFLQIHIVVEGLASRLELDKNIQVTGLRRIPPSPRTKEADAAYSEGMQERLPVCEGLQDSVSLGHDLAPLGSRESILTCGQARDRYTRMSPFLVPTLAADGTLYFGSDREGGKGGTDLWRSRLVDGKYTQPENLGDAVNSPGEEYEPLISPDGTVLIFMAARKGGQGSGDLWVSYLRDGAWTPAANLPPPINSPAFEVGPKVTPDGRTLVFTSTRRTFAVTPPDKALTYAELSRQLNSPGNGLGDLR